MNLTNGLIDQLEIALASPELSKRAELLRQVADLFVLGSGKFSDVQIDLFDEVMSTLLKNIECTARATFGSRLSRLPDAPLRTIRLLAFDDAPEVAAPVLEHSPRLDEVTLAENARTKSQDHLLAIAGRSQLTEPVTDVLVERGNSDVAGGQPVTVGPGSRSRECPGSPAGPGTMARSPSASGLAPISRARAC
ncbi:uncharacterized protein (DUF2336 family) [Bradyrhizobium diazoefficiens]